MKVLISIELGNDAMQTSTDVFEALRKSKLGVGEDDAPLQAGDGGTLRDTNGNAVGRWAVSG